MRTDEVHVFTGTYNTAKEEEPGPIQVVFTPMGEPDETPTWSVVFTVIFQTQEYTFYGTAEGGMVEGKLSGQVQNESGTQTFRFRGGHKDGMFEASHYELEGSAETPTGTMTLKRKQREQREQGEEREQHEGAAR